jgi:RNA-directed DNA polymerase
MSILEELASPEVWKSYCQYQKDKGYLTEKEEHALEEYCKNRSYEEVVSFQLPKKQLLNKLGTGKKRTVYIFSEDENMILKVMTWLLERYDNFFSSNCYAFRRGLGAGRAIRALTSVQDLAEKYSCKMDIRNYFNSIDVSILLPKLKRLLADDKKLYHFLEQLLTCDACVWQGREISEKRGAMAGTPTAGFLANLYLTRLDTYFEERQIPYARYSDDIIFFADSREEREQYKALVCDTLDAHGLWLNPDKLSQTDPGEPWEYLGISCRAGEIDLSTVALDKMKGKIRRKARALYRWRCRKQVGDEQIMRVMNRVFNTRFYDNPLHSEMTWARWFFPLLTTTQGLKVIDQYMQQYLRYLCSGKHGKANYKITYEQLKASGYRNLVHEYYRYRENPESYFESQECRSVHEK